jgi:WD40 repeat protein
MYGENQVCFLCESNGNIKRCVCDSFFKLIDNIQQPESQQIYRRPLKPLDLSYKDVYNLDCKGASTMCISLDGKWIVSGFIVPTREATKAPKSVVEVWSVESNSKYATLYGHRMYIHSLCMSADNRWIVSSARDQTMRIWSMEEKSQVAGLRGHTGDVNSVCISRDSRWIVSCSRDETIRVWSTKTMSEEAVFTGHEASVESVCLSVDSRIIVSGSEDCSLRVWSMKSKSEVAVLRGHTDL